MNLRGADGLVDGRGGIVVRAAHIPDRVDCIADLSGAILNGGAGQWASGVN